MEENSVFSVVGRESYGNLRPLNYTESSFVGPGYGMPYGDENIPAFLRTLENAAHFLVGFNNTIRNTYSSIRFTAQTLFAALEQLKNLIKYFIAKFAKHFFSLCRWFGRQFLYSFFFSSNNNMSEKIVPGPKRWLLRAITILLMASAALVGLVPLTSKLLAHNYYLNKRALATYNFQRGHAPFLEVLVGDELIIQDPTIHSADGWILAKKTKDGQVGYVPASHVRIF